MNLSNGLKPLSIYDKLLLPNYRQNCIVHIPNHIKYLQGLKEQSVLAVSEMKLDIKKTVLFIIDGFGYKQWHEHQPYSTVLSKIASEGVVSSVTSMFPSSTAPSITGLSTGLTTQQHGLIEWLMYEQLSDQIITTLPFKSIRGERDNLRGQVSPSVLISNPTLFQDLSENCVKTYSLVSEQYAKSTYSTLAYAGSTVISFETVEGLFVELTDILQSNEKIHVNVYWDKIDSAGHNYGPNSNEYALAVKDFFDAFEHFLRTPELSTYSDDTQILLTADHGQVTVDPQSTVWLDELPFLVDNLDLNKKGEKLLPWGLQRDVYLKVKDSKLDTTVLALREHLKDRAVVLKSHDALESGLFGYGELHPDFKTRIGNIIIIAAADNTVWYRHYDDEEFNYKGMHGGLTADETQIAFAQCPLNKLLMI